MDPILGLKWYLVFLFSTCCHEAAHAWSARYLGDDTAHRGGQTTLDPIPHIKREPIGMVVAPLLSFLLGGWMLGWASAPYDPHWALRYPKKAAAMAFAGPAANIALALLAVFLMKLGMEWGVFQTNSSVGMINVVSSTGSPGGLGGILAQLVSLFFSLNLLLAVFNLIPVPPLDGGSAPLFFLPEESARNYWHFMRNPAYSFIGLFIAWKMSGAIFPPIFRGALNLLYMIIDTQ